MPLTHQTAALNITLLFSSCPVAAKPITAGIDENYVEITQLFMANYQGADIEVPFKKNPLRVWGALALEIVMESSLINSFEGSKAN